MELAGIESPRLEAQVLAAHVMLVDRTWLIAHPEAEFHDLAGETLLQRRERREPLAYVLGFREFFGRRFEVNPNVLVPRHETETTLELALSHGDRLGDALKVLDIGVGSGAIAITLQLERRSWFVAGSDLSSKALSVAAQNAETLGADIRLTEADLTNAFASEQFRLIVSNPPYLEREEALMPELGYEPDAALYAEETGLQIYRRLSEEAHRVLEPEGVLVVEVGYTQGGHVRQIFEDRGWSHLETAKDLMGHDRALSFSRGARDNAPTR